MLVHGMATKRKKETESGDSLNFPFRDIAPIT
jgi:hypothetical protein